MGRLVDRCDRALQQSVGSATAEIFGRSAYVTEDLPGRAPVKRRAAAMSSAVELSRRASFFSSNTP